MDRGESTKRPKKIVAGDHIVRSEYTDGVLRNNHRCNNRLSREMQLFEKAQRVVMKDLGKETQLLRAKLSTTSLHSPRMRLEKNTNFVVEPFAVYGTNANPKKIKESPRKSKPRKPGTVIDGDEATEDVTRSSRLGRITPRNGMLQPMGKVETRSSIQNGVITVKIHSAKEQSGKRKAASKSGSKVGSAIRTDSELSHNTDSRAMRTDSVLSHVNDQRSPSRLVNSRLFFNDSKSDHKGGGGSSVRSTTVQGRRLGSPGPESRLSFIDILAEAEERKAKEAKRMTLELPMPRPKPPNPNTNYEDKEKAERRESIISIDFEQKRHGATPSATFVSSPRA